MLVRKGFIASLLFVFFDNNRILIIVETDNNPSKIKIAACIIKSLLILVIHTAGYDETKKRQSGKKEEHRIPLVRLPGHKGKEKRQDFVISS
ncbi:MAG: hypothetical protein LBB90_11740 [Tannerella sp.]|jgi:hypothetical protein|nr:hypothetical protein [Tannerella sp.]